MICPICGSQVSDDAIRCPSCQAQLTIYFAVTREHGSAWNDSLPMDGQKQFAEHSAYMGTLEDKGFVILGGPIGDEKRILLIFNTRNQKTLEKWLADDPWSPIDVLKTIKIEPWKVLIPDPIPFKTFA